ncbi:PREDICTED: slit homolog 2 protein-like [Branchiostoma belcheri]|uniref:Slit homolog 2 protein-like n=1 Tax=Branchiostoma belcheri TaxID=7741 RepID=A0A6P4Z425_BRABE|nr:PREDICTED: slit homolog 2 protein-like [Branchiostoma belcheri]
MLLTQCVVFMTLVASVLNVFPQRCFVGHEIICPKSNITSLPTKLPGVITKVLLQENRIQTIHDLSFFRHLVILNLRHNLLTTFPWESINHLRRLANLDLSHNLLSYVRLDLASGNLQSFYIDLSYNKLTTFSEANLGIAAVLRLRDASWLHIRRFIHGNQIHCDCRMFWLSEMASAFDKRLQAIPQWCPEDRGPLYADFCSNGVPKCSSPGSLKGVPIHRANLRACSAKQDVSTDNYNRAKTELRVYKTDAINTTTTKLPKTEKHTSKASKTTSVNPVTVIIILDCGKVMV